MIDVSDPDRVTSILWWVVIAAFIAAVISILPYISQFGVGLSSEHTIWGEFGDYASGVLGTLLSFFALVALLLTVVLQSKNIRLTSRELEESVGLLQKQTSVFKQQNFESTFFHLLRLHTAVVSEIDLRQGGDVTAQGRDCLRRFYKLRLDGIYNRRAPKVDNVTSPEFVQDFWGEFFNTYQNKLGHYFRLLYNIIKYVDRSDIENRQRYVNLLRAQLSTYELGLLFYNCLSEAGRPKFKRLAERYALFEDMETDILFEKAHMSLFKESAFEAEANK